ncbi:MAG: hypothetical protein B7X90_09455 [Novosphingobium sp. 17-62-19]|nr:MAG: hypothetical protein B7Y74_13905 [Novosphingobium sp. 35-62-5]OZA19194.1 MAG: hypothetical protein B7X90_09455 [Novosphingobium sp. 17-62-19]OZA72651.1 MAG: hypothetical protein B7X78_00625 [Sphingomonadales bacterium 39-62-4]
MLAKIKACLSGWAFFFEKKGFRAEAQRKQRTQGRKKLPMAQPFQFCFSALSASSASLREPLF